MVQYTADFRVKVATFGISTSNKIASEKYNVPFSTVFHWMKKYKESHVPQRTAPPRDNGLTDNLNRVNNHTSTPTVDEKPISIFRIIHLKNTNLYQFRMGTYQSPPCENFQRCLNEAVFKVNEASMIMTDMEIQNGLKS